MIENLVNANFDNIIIYHIRFAFSDEMDKIGNFSINKLFHAIKIVMMVILHRFKYNIENIYYPPSGPNKLPMFRDFIVLLSTRWLFKKTIFHFHASGISEIYNNLPYYIKPLYRLAYFNPDLSIMQSKLNPNDGQFLNSKKNIFLPHGIKDNSINFAKFSENKIPHILYIGVIKETKGIDYLIDACKILANKMIKFKLILVGKFDSKQYEKHIIDKICKYNLESYIIIKGVLIGEEKYKIYLQSDLLCFPTFFESESFGLVLLEAMQFSLPIVTTNWRAIPDIISDGEEGFLVPIKNSLQLANKLEVLVNEKTVRKIFGERARQKYLNFYTWESYKLNFEKIILSVI